MIGFIKNLFSGVLSFFIGLLGGKKSHENKPRIAAEKPAAATEKNKPSIAAEKPAAATAKKPAASAKTRKKSGYFMELDEAEEVKPLNGSQPPKVEAQKKPEPVAAAKPPAKDQSAKTNVPVAAATAAKVELVQTAEGVKAQPAQRQSSPAASANGQSQTETTFAPKYLAPSSSSNRRRPGPSMNPFLDMASQVKTPG